MKQASFPSIFRSETGSFAVVMAVSLMCLVTVLAFALDLGYFAKEKGSYQACADAAALAAAENLCCGRAEEAAIAVAMGTNVLLPEDSITVTLGFYDIYDDPTIDDFSVYKNFVAEDSDEFTENVFVNAVMVTIENEVKSLTGFNNTKNIKAVAVSYVPGVDWVAQKHFFSSNGGDKVAFHHGNIYAGKIVRLYGTAASDRIKIAAGKRLEIKKCTKLADEDDPASYGVKDEIQTEGIPESKLIEKYLISEEDSNPLDDYVKKMKKKADTVYTLGEPTDGGVFYNSFKDEETKEIYCFFDLSKEHDDHEIIYFDVPEDKDVTAFITTTPCESDRFGGNTYFCRRFQTDQPGASNYCGVDTKTPFGKAIKNLTFVTTASISIPRQKEPGVELGDTGKNQVNFVSSKDIFFSSEYNPLKGVSFFCKEFYLSLASKEIGYQPPDKSYIKVIANGGCIKIDKCDTNPSLDKYDFYLKFGLPCPRVFPVALGKLEE